MGILVRMGWTTTWWLGNTTTTTTTTITRGRGGGVAADDDTTSWSSLWRLYGNNASITVASSNTVHDNDSNNNDQQQRPYFILHIGPPKSGTTTLQEELTAAQNNMHGWLQLDNYLYTGQYYKRGKLTHKTGNNHTGSSRSNMPFIKSILSQQCHLQLEKRRLKFYRQQQQQEQRTNKKQSITTPTTTLANVLGSVQCWKDALNLLESYRLNQTNIIHSDETYGYKWRDWDIRRSSGVSSSSTSMQRNENTTAAAAAGPWDWISLYETLHDAGWNVVVVLGYRRYAEWIVSVKQHAEKWTGRKPRHAMWPTMEPNNPGEPAGGGLLFAPPFPNILTVRSGHDDRDDENYDIVESLLSLL
jgi:hypothetical protein